jgi:phenylalanyl-tRNA synthetase alpha subunit
MGGDMKPKLLERYGDDLYFQPKNHPRRHPDDGFYLRQDDWCATAYWYQYPLVRNLPPLPGKAARTADLFGSAREEKGTADL